MYMKVKRWIQGNAFLFKILKPIVRACQMCLHIVKNNYYPLLETLKFQGKNGAKIAKLKNAYAGKRCFIIGNGPSLLIKDLDKLINEYTFGVNRIYKAYDSTKWRPSFFIIQDVGHIDRLKDELKALDCPLRFSPSNLGYRLKGYILFNMLYNISNKEMPKFSHCPNYYLYAGGTVVYSALQLAVFMGFSELYLLGVDNSYQNMIGGTDAQNDKKLAPKQNHFFQEDAQNGSEKSIYVGLTNLSYESAKLYCDKHNVKVYNATRGGMLETFPRIDFEELF